MNDQDVLRELSKNLLFGEESIDKLKKFHSELLIYNKKYNLISKSSEGVAWVRHILDSAQLVKLINFDKPGTLSDLGSGAGFPGIILAIFNKNPDFHVKLYEKSNIKCNFLNNFIDNHDVSAKVFGGNYRDHKIEANFFTLFHSVCHSY